MIRAALVVAAATAVTLYGQQPSMTRSWPPAVERASQDAPVLSPADALARFALPPGYRIELAASEPLIQDPIAIEWDAEGRLWAVELPGYMRDIMASGELEPTGRIVVLEDTDDDGVMDRRQIFADGLVQPRAVLPLERGALLGEPPNVWLLEDSDGDLRADGRTLVAGGYGRHDTNVEVNANGLLWALDNRIYTAGTGADLIVRLKNGSFQAEPSLARGQWGLTQDDSGRIYRNHNESVLHADLVPTPYYARNPHLLRTRGSHERLVSATGDVNQVWPARQTPGTNRAYQHGVLREDGTLGAFTAACAPTVYRGDRLPRELHGNVFVAEPAANFVSRIIVQDDGTTLRARKAYDGAEFLTSTDERFRPVNLSSGPDGTLYVVDMYRGIIQHRAYITEYLRDHITARKLEAPIGFGRIYRVVHESTVRDTASRLPADAAGVVVTLSHPNGWWRDAAQRRLVHRGEGSVAPALRKLFETSPDWRVRLHALWTLDGLGAAAPALVVAALSDASRDLRSAALRIAERWLTDAGSPIARAVRERMSDPDWAVRQQLAASLGELTGDARLAALVPLIEQHGGDPIVLDAALSGLRHFEASALQRLMAGASHETPARAAALTMLSATVMRSRKDDAAQRVFAWIAEEGRPRWQRVSLAHGTEIALLGAEMPGAGPTRAARAAAAAAPCPTCPGGRAGPGGAYAFRDPAAVASRGSGSGRSGAPALRLAREPAVPQAADDRQLADRMRHVLARVSWPGKARGAPAPTPMTADEEQRFGLGRDVYAGLCQACHQPDGRGQERLAPSLIGSALTLSAPEVPIRILLHGKQGTVGLMPPVGSVLSDEQIAGVLTYVRREWGHDGTPVDPGIVRQVRKSTAERKSPWTDAELKALDSGGRR